MQPKNIYKGKVVGLGWIKNASSLAKLVCDVCSFTGDDDNDNNDINCHPSNIPSTSFIYYASLDRLWPYSLHQQNWKRNGFENSSLSLQCFYLFKFSFKYFLAIFTNNLKKSFLNFFILILYTILIYVHFFIISIQEDWENFPINTECKLSGLTDFISNMNKISSAMLFSWRNCQCIHLFSFTK